MAVPLIDDVWKTFPHASIPGEPVEAVKLTPQAVPSLAVRIRSPNARDRWHPPPSLLLGGGLAAVFEGGVFQLVEEAPGGFEVWG